MHGPLASHCTLAESDVTSRHHLEQAMIDPNNGLTYADSGVDIDAGNRLVELIKPMVRATARAGAEAEIGGFAGGVGLEGRGRQDTGLVPPAPRRPAKPNARGPTASHSPHARG